MKKRYFIKEEKMALNTSEHRFREDNLFKEQEPTSYYPIKCFKRLSIIPIQVNTGTINTTQELLNEINKFVFFCLKEIKSKNSIY